MSKWYPAIQVDFNSWRLKGRLNKDYTTKPEVGDQVIVYESEEQGGMICTVSHVNDMPDRPYWLVSLTEDTND